MKFEISCLQERRVHTAEQGLRVTLGEARRQQRRKRKRAAISFTRGKCTGQRLVRIRAAEVRDDGSNVFVVQEIKPSVIALTDNLLKQSYGAKSKHCTGKKEEIFLSFVEIRIFSYIAVFWHPYL